jgi:UDP-N-acetylglucosamine 2-epimerase (non-hydrolysing)
MEITIIAGARPNFMKIAPIINAIETIKNEGGSIAYQFVHTGQHYDEKMSHTFFRQLGIPEPNINLNCGGGSQAEQTASIMIRFEAYLFDHKTDLVLVVGDVTSTMACAIVAKKMGIKVAHVEAGIRSGDWSMPEEINRIVTDSISDYYFTTSETANLNLIKSGVENKRIFFVGNTMIDTLNLNLSKLRKPDFWIDFKLRDNNYFVLTLHRPSNVDSEINFFALLDVILSNARDLPVVFPIHPRTAKLISKQTLNYANLYIVDPLGYFEFIYLIKNSKAVITDSGGITEETTVLGIPCLTLRDTTERPETVTLGTNELLGKDFTTIAPAMCKIFDGNWKKGVIPPLWDGMAAHRIVEHLINLSSQGK